MAESLCVFCEIVVADDPDVLVYRSESVVGFLDLRPVFAGHLLFVPRRHIPTLAELPSELMVPLLSAVQLGMAALETAFDAQGTFVATNNRVSQSVPHLHLHVVPRKRKDGLRGFFWPRHPYADAADLTAARQRIRTAIQAHQAATAAARPESGRAATD